MAEDTHKDMSNSKIEQMRFDSLPPLDQDPKDEQNSEFKKALAEAKNTNEIYLAGIESLDYDSEDHEQETGLDVLKAAFGFLEWKEADGSKKSYAPIIRKNKFAIDDEETSIGVKCIASPLFDTDGIVNGAMGISGPSVRITQNNMKDLTKKSH